MKAFVAFTMSILRHLFLTFKAVSQSNRRKLGKLTIWVFYLYDWQPIRLALMADKNRFILSHRRKGLI
jgi:hypothetical protein